MYYTDFHLPRFECLVFPIVVTKLNSSWQVETGVCSSWRLCDVIPSKISHFLFTEKDTMSDNTALNQESLFSLEVVVDSIRLDRNIGCRFPATAFRLLDFPTLLVYHVEPDLGERIKAKINADPLYEVPNQLLELQDKHGQFVVKKGKSCLFKVSPNTLWSHLQTMPLYVMVVDTYPDTPKLVGSCTVPLDSCMNEVYNDIQNLGLSVPSVRGVKGSYAVCNLMGREIGHIVLGTRLLSLGVGLLQHIPESSVAKLKKQAEVTVVKEIKDLGKEEHSEKVVLYDLETLDKPVQVCIEPERTPFEDFQGQTDINVMSNISTQTMKHKKKINRKHVEVISPKVNDEIDDFITTNMECPPPLFFNSKLERPTSQSLLLSYYPLGLPALETGAAESESDRETIRSEDRFSDSDTEVDSSQLIKPVERDFNPKTVCQPKAPPPRQIQGSIAELPILNALLQEIVSLQSGQLISQHTDNRSKIATQRAPRSPPLSARAKQSESPRAVLPRQRKHDQQKDGSHSVSPHHTISGKIRPRTSSPSVVRRHVCEGIHDDAATKQIITSKGKSMIKRPVSAGVPKTKLQPGMTNTQRLRLAKTNPHLLETLEKAEQERLQRRQQMLQKKIRSRQITSSTDLADVSTEISHHPLKERGEGKMPLLDVYGSREDTHHKKPVPTPRQSVNSKEFHDATGNENTAPLTPRPRKSKQQATGEDDARSEQQDRTCYSEPHSSKIEVYVPSASVDDAYSDSTFIDDLELDSPRPASRRLNVTKVLNKPGFPQDDSLNQKKSADNDDQQLPATSKEREECDLGSKDFEYNNKSGTLEGLSAGEELGLRCIVERYSDDSSEKPSHGDELSCASKDSQGSGQLDGHPVRKLTLPEKLKPASSVFSPDTFNESHASRQPTMATRQPFMAVSVSDMMSNTQDSTAYLNHSQVNSQMSVDSTSSYTRTEQESMDTKQPKPSPRTPRLPRNISVRTDSLSSYVPSDHENLQQLSQDGDTGDNYSDSFEEDNEDDSEILVKPKFMKDIQVDPTAKLGYTWGY